MGLSALEAALRTVTDKVFRYLAFGAEDQYIVWAEDGQSVALWADGQMQEQVIEGTIDYFTRTEGDQNVAKIQSALNAADIPFRLSSVQYEDATGFIHYEWVFEVIA